MFKRQESVADNQVNRSVRRVATLDEDWVWRQRSEFLYRWADIFNREFFRGHLPQPVISFQYTRRNTLGHFVPARNECGLNFNINLNQQHLNRSEADLLETLVHEQIHLYQSVTGTAGRGNYHNKAFVEKAARIGLKVRMGRGCRDGPPGDPFVALLRKHGVSFQPRTHTETAAAQFGRARNSQRLRRWACNCKAVWCGGTLEALCLRCHAQFVIQPSRSDVV